MKKSFNIWLIIAACFILIGALCFCFIMSANHWNFSLIKNEKIETATYDIHAAFHDISINSDTEDIEFCLSDDGMCKVVCRERENEKHNVYVQNGVLIIDRTDTRKWYDNVSLYYTKTSITVFLPQSAYGALSIEEETGDIKIPKTFNFENINMNLSTGNVDCRASVTERLHVATDTGNIHLQDLSAGELNLSVSTGHITVMSVACKGNVGASVSTGKTEIEDISCKSISSIGSTGDITMKNVIAADKISIERSTGDVKFDQCDADELEIKTDTGKVSGTLLSSKVFIARSDTGFISVPETTSGGKCKISTDTGDIKITLISSNF